MSVCLYAYNTYKQYIHAYDTNMQAYMHRCMHACVLAYKTLNAAFAASFESRQYICKNRSSFNVAHENAILCLVMGAAVSGRCGAQVVLTGGVAWLLM